MAITLPPKKSSEDEKIQPDEKKIRDVINKGGSPTKVAKDENEEVLRNINIRLFDSELQKINELRERRPKARGGKRMGISLHDWIVEAVQEKIKSEMEK